MPQERLSMQKIKTLLRLAALGLSQRQIALSCQIGQATVSEYLGQASQAGLKWPDVADWEEDRLAAGPSPRTQPQCELAQNRRAGLHRYAEGDTDP